MEYIEFNPETHELFIFNLDCGRMGRLKGLLFAHPKEIDFMIGRSVAFGEVLGKHSDIEARMKNTNFIKVEGLDSKTKQVLFNALGRTVSGHNPIDVYFDSSEEWGDVDFDDLVEEYKEHMKPSTQ